MENYKILNSLSKEILKECSAKLTTDHTVETISMWIEKQMFTKVAILVILSSNSGKITKDTLEKMKSKFSSKCKMSKTMSGGRLGSATYLGANEQMYTQSNTGTDVGKIDLKNDDIIRNQVGGYVLKNSSKLKTILQLHLKYYNTKMEKDVKDYLIANIISEIKCVKNDLMQVEKLTTKKLISIIKKHNTFS